MRGPTTTVISFAALETVFGPVYLFGTARGLVTVALPEESRAVGEARARALLGPVTVIEDAGPHAAALDQLAGYFAGTRRDFDLPIDWRGTPFQRLVWQAVMAVPYGETRTYGQIAALLGRPAAARAVGAANGANPLPPIVPCHRLVGADGALRGYRGGLPIKRRLLGLERGKGCDSMAHPAARVGESVARSRGERW